MWEHQQPAASFMTDVSSLLVFVLYYQTVLVLWSSLTDCAACAKSNAKVHQLLLMSAPTFGRLIYSLTQVCLQNKIYIYI